MKTCIQIYVGSNAKSVKECGIKTLKVDPNWIPKEGTYNIPVSSGPIKAKHRCILANAARIIGTK